MFSHPENAGESMVAAMSNLRSPWEQRKSFLSSMLELVRKSYLEQEVRLALDERCDQPTNDVHIGTLKRVIVIHMHLQSAWTSLHFLSTRYMLSVSRC